MTRRNASRKIDPALAKYLKKALPIACDAANLGGELIARKFGRFRQLTHKPDTSLVTEVDKASEKLVLGRLRKAFSNDTIIAEETGLSSGRQQSEFRWHVDPLDGTTNFVHGFPFFCVSIGLEFEQRDLVLGVIYQPITKELYTASAGSGAFKNRKRLHVSKTSKLAESLLSTGFSMRRDTFYEDEIRSFTRITATAHAVRRTGSAALDIAHVATGQFDGFWERGLSSWDMAAGLALVQEAGGAFSRMDGKPFRIGETSLLASNGLIHKEIIAAARGNA